MSYICSCKDAESNQLMSSRVCGIVLLGNGVDELPRQLDDVIFFGSFSHYIIAQIEGIRDEFYLLAHKHMVYQFCSGLGKLNI